jgi:hypothetical protein
MAGRLDVVLVSPFLPYNLNEDNMSLENLKIGDMSADGMIEMNREDYSMVPVLTHNGSVAVKVPYAKVREVLLNAADAIEARGLRQWGYHGETPEICTMGAIAVGAGHPAWQGVSTSVPEINAAADKMADYVARTDSAKDWRVDYKDRVESASLTVCGWNNEAGRTKEQVSAALRAAAAH